MICLAAMLAACHKDTQLEHKDPQVTEYMKSIAASRVEFSWDVEYLGKVGSVVTLSLKEDMSEAIRYGSEEMTDQKHFEVTATGLSELTKYYYYYEVWNSTMSYHTEVKSFTTVSSYLATVSTSTVIDITAISATGGGNVMDDGGTEIIERGICWSKEPNPTIENDHDYDHDHGGIGSYSVEMTGLEDHTTYYVRAYVTNSKGTNYGGEVNFTTGLNIVLTTGEVFDITDFTATGGGNITFDGGVGVTERGICWNTEHDPTIEGDHASDGQMGMGEFTVEMTGLQHNTTYYVRAYGINEHGINYGNEVSFTTMPSLPTVITVEVTDITYRTAVCVGNVIDEGGVEIDERGICWSTEHDPSIEGGHVSDTQTGMGEFTAYLTGLHPSTTYYVRAYAVNSEGVGYGGEVSFNTWYVPVGGIAGVFSVGPNKKVYFSRGNLQYKASTNTWRFATNQYDYVGNNNANASSSYDGWIDLFGWGTSGYNHGANCYQPWSKSVEYADYYAYGIVSLDLSESTGMADWGYNAISNGGNTENQWRTLTKDEWEYVMKTRPASTLNGTANARYAKAVVNGVNGVIVFSDFYTHPSGVPQPVSVNIGNSTAGWNTNIYSASDWNAIEAQGAIFLPAAGNRYGDVVDDVNTKGYYWSATSLISYYCHSLNFHSSALDVGGSYRYFGRSVRLVHDIR